MLDTETKKRIDTARDILVGVVPNPQSQVEQITIAMIYKFMDDMDAEAEELGGERKFFNGEFAKYGWAKLMSPATGGHEMRDLYVEAIAGMTGNQGIPPLFRDMFKNAYLPYRNPETLRSFLKIINDFEYDHSERLGDAFEYLLSILGAQGDAGQFRTPRHIIDFMVAVIDPKKEESILDPACGTAGFLISAWKHILHVNSREGRKGAGLTPDQRKRLADNIKGYDISPDMVRLSLVNLYLHGFTDPHISEYDTLTSEDKWNEYSDIILANPPFMSPKGGIMPHKRFSVEAKRSEVLFVDYIAKHLTPNGRAAVIVPEGIIFEVKNAYKQLRKMLVEEYLYAVVSLPAGVFKPYSGVQTSILLMDKTLAKKCDSILFVKVENDGFDLGAKRHKIEKNDLPEALETIQKFIYMDGQDKKEKSGLSMSNALMVEKEKIAENGEWNLSGERYRESDEILTNWNLVELSEFVDYEQPTNYIVDSVNYDGSYETPVLTAGKSFLLGYTNEKNGIFDEDKLPVIIFDDFTTAIKFVDFPFKVKSSAMKILHINSNKAEPKFVYHSMKNINFSVNEHKRYWISQYSKIKIPLPPLKIQQEIVVEIEGYQKIIDGARAVVDNYNPKIKINPDWEMVKLGDVCNFKRGPFGGNLKKDIFVENGYAVYEQSHAIYNQFRSIRYFIDEAKFDKMRGFEVNSGDLIMSCSGTTGKVAIVPNDIKPGIINQALLKLAPKPTIAVVFLKLWMESNNFQESLNSSTFGAAIKNVASVKVLKEMMIPLPPLKIQQEIVAEIEKEQSLVNAGKELVTLFEQKIKDKIASVWGE